MNDRLAELYRGVAVHATADLEHRAAFELLALVMMADTRVETAVVDTIRGISEDWRVWVSRFIWDVTELPSAA